MPYDFMCNKGNEILSELESKSEVPISQEQAEHEAVYLMDDPIVAPSSAPSSNNDRPCVKFLCSFSGSILPRPHDGKLRYVGGETRIVSLPRDVTYEEFVAKLRELFDGATVLKYQHPDEDLDALVSVVNDDDVTNMMEEYDKLGAGIGFTRLRIFLFSHADQDVSLHFVDGDERDNERRYVDALNSLNESPNNRRNQTGETQSFGPADDGHVAVAEQFFNQMSLEGGLHNQRNIDMLMPPINLRQLTIPPLIPARSISQMESPWSPAYHSSPRQPGVLEPTRQAAEYPTSPSPGCYQTNQSLYEHQQQYTESLLMFPTTVPSEKAGFPGNIMHETNIFEGNCIYNNCRMTFQRNQPYPETLWQPGDHQHVEPQTMGNGFHQVGTPCAECPPKRDMLMLNTDTSIHHPYYSGEQNDPRPVYNGNVGQERGWVFQHQLTPRAEELGPYFSGAGRMSDHHVADNNTSISHGRVGIPESHYVPLHLVHHDDPHYIRGGHEVSSQVFHDPALAAGSNMHVQPMDEGGIRNANPSYVVKADGSYQVAHGHAPVHALWRNVQSPMLGGTSYEASGPPQLTNGLINSGYIRMEGSPRFRAGLENQNTWVESSQRTLGFDSTPVFEPFDGGAHYCLPNAYGHENGLLHKVDAVPCLSDMLNVATPLDPSMASGSLALVDDKLIPAITGAVPVTLIKSGCGYHKQAIHEETLEPPSLGGFAGADQKMGPDDVGIHESDDSTLVPIARNSGPTKAEESDNNVPVAVACVGEVKSGVGSNGERVDELDAAVKEEHQYVLDALDGRGDLEAGSDSENSQKSKIEPTKAEEEALARGLQTIRNEDLEEIRELGTGTYGAVYHGKWKGSAVAIKRIKAGCFAGKPSERERLISDFWKEALILSSLHHPNVVSFYGVVRDGPDGSLATVTEFMVNGSLKQFLQKKDRTIDRRKRLMIAMDTAFGMEYLHGKSIVHFDLKCENLLVNMRDPHRPVCKIGDLGLSKVKQHTLVSGGVRGTLPWMAPELLSGKNNMVTEKIDVYSFGVVMWELLTGDEPYKDMHCASIIGGIVNNTLRPAIPTWCDPEWKSLMESCWAADPALRPSFSEISQKLRSMAASMNIK